MLSMQHLLDQMMTGSDTYNDLTDIIFAFSGLFGPKFP